jgi:hypothetical protein
VEEKEKNKIIGLRRVGASVGFTEGGVVYS